MQHWSREAMDPKGGDAPERGSVSGAQAALIHRRPLRDTLKLLQVPHVTNSERLIEARLQGMKLRFLDTKHRVS